MSPVRGWGAGVPPVPGAGGCWLAGPPPQAGAVLQRGAGLGNFGSVVLGARELAGSRGEQVGAWKALAGFWRGGHWWEASARKCGHLHPADPPVCVLLLSWLCIASLPGTLGKVMPGEGSSPPPALAQGEADAPQGGAARRLRLPKAPTLGRGPGRLQVRGPSALKAEWSQLCTAGAYLPCPSCSQGGRCPPCLPGAEQESKHVKRGKGAAWTHRATQPGYHMGKGPCGFVTS